LVGGLLLRQFHQWRGFGRYFVLIVGLLERQRFILGKGSACRKGQATERNEKSISHVLLLFGSQVVRALKLRAIGKQRSITPIGKTGEATKENQYAAFL
jgi:hypothetical protein